MTTSSILLDVIAVGLIVIMFFVAKRKGFVRSVLNLLGTAISALAAYITSGPAGDFVYNTLARGNVINAIQSVLDAGGATADGIVSSVTSTLSVLASDANLPADIQSALAGLSGQSNDVVAAALADGPVALAMSPLMRGVCFVVLFFLFLIVVRILANLLSKGLHKLPIIGTVDCWLGGVVGLAEGLLLVLVMACVISMIPAVTGSPLVTQADIDATYLFRYFYGFIQM